jgi:hypothetical protein
MGVLLGEVAHFSGLFYNRKRDRDGAARGIMGREREILHIRALPGLEHSWGDLYHLGHLFDVL